MNVFLRLPGGQSKLVELASLKTVKDLKSRIEEISGISQDTFKLIHSAKFLDEESEISSIENGSTLDLNFPLVGGVGASGIPDHLRELAMKYKCNKMICRKCYARLPPNAHNCRKRKCGHCANIRAKKKIKEKEKGKG
jgi:large subunit ribosomal protein L40e